MIPQSVRTNVVIPGLLLLVLIPALASDGIAYTLNQYNSENLVYLGSDAFGDISRMVESDCDNGVDDDGDGLTDMEDVEDCA
jgi:hypothetical protein